MKFNKTILASATCAAMGVAAGNAHALNFGEFWAADQVNGKMHIFDQSDLNDPTVDAIQTVYDYQNQIGSSDGGTHSSPKLHILGFSNHAGLDPRSRTVVAYLDGWGEMWKTNAGTHAPTKVADLEASTINAYAEEGLGAPDKGDTVHACGGNPQNTLISCASIFNGDMSLFSADMGTDTYTRLGIWRLADLPLSPSLSPSLGNTVQAAMDEMIMTDSDNNPNNLCNQFSTDGRLLYVAAQSSSVTGGVIVVDVSDPTNPTILDAFSDMMAPGCGLVNHPDGQHLWITHGFNKQGDPEEISIWRYSRAGKANGPIRRVALPVDDVSQEIYGGDAHGMQLAGITNSFMWQIIRVDDTIAVATANDSRTASIVNVMSTERPGRENVQADVIDRSQFGTRMYWTTRGPIPITAIGSLTAFYDPTRYNNTERSGVQGVDVWSSNIFGFNGYYLKTETMPSDGVSYLCPGEPYEQVCNEGDEGAVAVDNSDPHGGKSLNYLSGF